MSHSLLLQQQRNPRHLENESRPSIKHEVTNKTRLQTSVPSLIHLKRPVQWHPIGYSRRSRQTREPHSQIPPFRSSKFNVMVLTRGSSTSKFPSTVTVSRVANDYPPARLCMAQRTSQVQRDPDLLRRALVLGSRQFWPAQSFNLA